MTVVFTSLKITSNPNCPTGYTTAPGLNSSTTRNCTSCHGDYSLNTAGGGITVTGLPTTFTPGSAYPFSVKVTHSAANRTVWGVAIKAVDTVTHAVIGTWITTNPNTSIKGSAGGSSYELSHANAATSTATNTYTYSNLTWTAPALPTAVQSRVKFYVSAVAGNNNGNEAGDYVYATSLTSNQYVAPTPCTFTYGTWTTCSNGTQTRTYTTSPAGCTGTPPTDSITRTCTVVPPTGLPNAVTITATDVVGVCDTIKKFSVPVQSGVFYAWSVTGTGNYIINGQGTNSIDVVVKVAGIAYVSLSNTTGSIPAVSSAFTKKLPPTPSVLNGSLSPCPNSTFTYTATNPVPTATQSIPARFRWTLPLGSVINSANADSSSVSITFNSNFVGGTLAVKNETSCGIFGSAKSIVLSPSKVIDVVSSTGFFNGCIGNSMNFTAISPVNGGVPVSLFRWTKPASATITSANVDSSTITLRFDVGYKGGALKVQTSSSCNTLGTAVSKTLTHVGCAAGQRGSSVEILSQDLVNIFPNPSNGEFTLNIQTGNLLAEQILVRLVDVTGKLVTQFNTPSLNGVVSKRISLPNVKPGVYFITYIVDGKKNTMKVYIIK